MRLPLPPDHSASPTGPVSTPALPPPRRSLPPPNHRTGTYLDPHTGQERWRANGRVLSKDKYKQRPSNWGPRYDLMLWMHIAGQRTIDIAKALKYTPARVSAIIHSPLFQSKKLQILEELKDSTIEDILEQIRREAGPNFEFLVSFRNDIGQEPRARLAAAKQIAMEVDRVYPRRIERKEERTIRLTIDAETLRRMSEAMAQVKGLDTVPVDAVYSDLEEEGRLSLPSNDRHVRNADDYLREIEQLDPGNVVEAASSRGHS